MCDTLLTTQNNYLSTKKKFPKLQKFQKKSKSSKKFLQHQSSVSILIKVLGLGSPTTDLRIQPLKSRSTIVELFLLSIRASPQNLSQNERRSVVQMADQSSEGLSFSTIRRSSLPLSPSLISAIFSTHFPFFFCKKTHFLDLFI